MRDDNQCGFKNCSENFANTAGKFKHYREEHGYIQVADECPDTVIRSSVYVRGVLQLDSFTKSMQSTMMVDRTSDLKDICYSAAATLKEKDEQKALKMLAEEIEAMIE